ncbi:MAG: hypothetical protein WCG83_03315 [Candidatus Peregrinibacteria bacterium]
MTTFQDLLHCADERVSPTPGFVGRVFGRIALLREQRKLKGFLMSSIAAGILILVLAHFLSLLIVNISAGTGRDIIAACLEDPMMLLNAETWGALWDNALIANVLFSLLTICLLSFFVWKSRQIWHSSPPSHAH